MNNKKFNHWRNLIKKSLHKKTTFSRFAFSLFLVLLTLLFRLLTAPILGNTTALLPFLIPVIFGAWYGGFWPGVFATLLGVILSNFFFTEPIYQFKYTSPSHAVSFVIFFIEGFIISGLSQLVIETTGKLKETLESINDSFFTLDHRSRFKYVNKHALSYFGGLELKSLIGKNIWVLFPDTKKTLSYKKYKEAIKTQKALHYEEYIPTRNKWFDSHIYPSKNGVSVYFTDITNRKLTEQKLRESENRFKELADHAPVLIWMAGTDKLRYYFNKSWLDFTGRKISQEVGNGWQETIHPDDLNQVLDIYNSSFDARIDFQIEYRLKRFDQEYRWMLVTGVPRFTKNQNFLGYLGTCIDITERKQLEEDKDNFISVASHELKTPLTTINAYTQLLNLKLTKTTSPQIKEYVEKISRNIEKLGDLVTDLLDVSRIENGKLMYDKKIFNLEELVEEIIADIQPISPKHKIVFKTKNSAKVLGDPNRISQVLVNLLTNAIKYSPKPGKVIVTIEKTKGTKNSITVSVRDFGIGIPKAEQEKVFQRFYRVDTIQGKTISGFGLGLHITAEIIKRHGGNIWVHSIKDKGSTFSFTLPTEK